MRVKPFLDFLALAHLVVSMGHARHVAHTCKFAEALESLGKHLIVSSQEVELTGPNDSWWVLFQDLIAGSSWIQLFILIHVLEILIKRRDQLVATMNDVRISIIVFIIMLPLIFRNLIR